MMGLINGLCSFKPMELLDGDRKIAGSDIGGIKETIDLLKLCDEKQI